MRTSALAVERRLAPIEGAVLAYRRALEAEVAREYAHSHSLPQVRAAGPTAAAAARSLVALVSALPELEGAVEVSGPEPARAQAAPTLATGPAEAATSPLATVLPRVATAAVEQMLVILGSLAGRKRQLPDPLGARTEWIDTSQGGDHAVMGLPTRIRQGRVFGVVICESVISHKHTDPVVAAARAAHVPVGFAGKGGNAGLARALRAIEAQLTDSATTHEP